MRVAWIVVASLLGALALAFATVRADKDDDACRPRLPFARYSTKTAYELVHSNNVEPADTLRGCETAYVWHILRHGTRYMTDPAKVRDAVTRLQAGLAANQAARRVEAKCVPAVDRMLSWTLDVRPEQAELLTTQGEQDMFGIGSRMRTRFGAFFDKHARPGAFTFRSTDTQRTMASAEWYGRGLFTGGIDLPKPVHDDPLLKFYELCPAWDEAVDKNASVHEEEHKFRDGPFMRGVLERVSQRLGFEKPLAYDDVKNAWEACRFDQAWHVTQEAPWCAAFDEEDLIVFEYMQDTKLYYSGGYGSGMDARLGCVPIKDMLERFSALRAGNATSRGSMYFTHSKALQLTMTSVGVGRQSEPLTADSFERMSDDRAWRTSRLLPFAANLAFVLYQCPAVGDNKGEEYKVRMYVNERPTPVPGCTDKDALCSLDDFEERLGSAVSTCSLDFCGSKGGGGGASSGSTARSSSVLYAILTAAATTTTTLILGRAIQ